MVIKDIIENRELDEKHEKILKVISEKPGISQGRLHEILKNKMARQTLRDKLRDLEKMGLIRVEKGRTGQAYKYYPTELSNLHGLLLEALNSLKEIIDLYIYALKYKLKRGEISSKESFWLLRILNEFTTYSVLNLTLVPENLPKHIENSLRIQAFDVLNHLYWEPAKKLWKELWKESVKSKKTVAPGVKYCQKISLKNIIEKGEFSFFFSTLSSPFEREEHTVNVEELLKKLFSEISIEELSKIYENILIKRGNYNKESKTVEIRIEHENGKIIGSKFLFFGKHELVITNYDRVSLLSFLHWIEFYLEVLRLLKKRLGIKEVIEK